ncbi:RING finger protein 11-like [Babylonia areolata]|uniref:RING finger protein 11-like n=1 Tax=Babylonia areolata TaxID=304850 RepID=UPI003FCF8A7D
MGNCFKSQSSDDISLLRGSDVPDQQSQQVEPQPVGPPPPYQEAEVVPVYHPSPNVSRPATQLTEEEQIKIAQRLGLINHLPMGVYDGCSKKAKECVICMCEFTMGDMLRFLPCMHIYHKDCIDDWLMRSFTCPSCMEPVDAALLTTYETS